MKYFISIGLAALLAVSLPAASAQTSAPPASNEVILTPSNSPATTPVAAVNSTNATPVALDLAPVDPDKAFADGVAAYTSGNFAKARDAFAAAETVGVSPALEYNFGNAGYETGDYGNAILHYLRSLSLNPRDPDARQNLALARKAANLVLADPPALDVYSGWLTLNGWTWIVTLAGWTTLYLALLPRLFRWRGALPVLLCLLVAVITIGGGIGFWGAWRHAHEGVILRADTQLKFSPTTNSQAIAVAQPGEIAQTLRAHAGYYEVRLPDGRSGWVEDAVYAPVWK